jgi:uncharacterized protein DUF4384
MVLPLVALLLQTPQASTTPPPDARPVRVWLGSSGALARGTPVRVYVQAAQDGNLIVLHRRTDGRIDVLFPGRPNDDPFVRAGTYEIQTTPSRVAFVVAEPDGSGLVLAALAPRPYRFEEFVRAAAWNPDALGPTWDGSDSEGVLSDIVQRMLGDDYFNYDIASYTVAPPVYAMPQDTNAPYPMYPACIDCTFIGLQQNVFETLVLCDALFAPCIGHEPFRHHRRGRDEAPAAAAPSRTIALSMRGASRTAVIPRNGRSSTAANPPIGPRARAPLARPPERASLPIRAVPLGLGSPAVARAPARPAVPTRRRTVSAPVDRAPRQVVRLTLTPTRVREDRPPSDPPSGSGSLVLPGVTVTPPVQAAPRQRTLVSPEGLAARLAAPATFRERGLVVAGAGSRAGADASAPATGRTQGIALPPAVFHGVRAQVPVTRAGSRRR